MANNGKLEGLITSDGWALLVTETGGGTGSASIAAGDYYLSTVTDTTSSLIATLEAGLNSDPSLTATYTVSLSAGEGGTGRVTITASGGSVTAIELDWITISLRDVLGFDGTENGTLSFTGNGQARSLWLPDCPAQKLNAGPNWAGTRESDMQTRESASGHLYAVSGQVKVALENLAWPGVAASKTWIANELIRHQSFERFWLDAILGRAAWASAGGPVRYHEDAGSLSYFTYRVAGPQNFKPEPLRPNSAIRFRVEIPRMVQLPSEVDD